MPLEHGEQLGAGRQGVGMAVAVGGGQRRLTVCMPEDGLDLLSDRLRAAAGVPAVLCHVQQD